MRWWWLGEQEELPESRERGCVGSVIDLQQGVSLSSSFSLACPPGLSPSSFCSRSFTIGPSTGAIPCPRSARTNARGGYGPSVFVTGTGRAERVASPTDYEPSRLAAREAASGTLRPNPGFLSLPPVSLDFSIAARSLPLALSYWHYYYLHLSARTPHATRPTLCLCSATCERHPLAPAGWPATGAMIDRPRLAHAARGTNVKGGRGREGFEAGGL